MTSTELEQENKGLLAEYLVLKLNERFDRHFPKDSYVIRIGGYYFSLENGSICSDSLYPICDLAGYMTMPTYNISSHSSAAFLRHTKNCQMHNKQGEIIPHGRESELATASV